MASTFQTNTVVETFSDGSYIESSISFPSTSKALSSSSTKTASKTSTYKNNSGKTLWSVTVTGSFTYNVLHQNVFVPPYQLLVPIAIGKS